MQRYGLIGYPLTHSFSKRYFTDKFKRQGIDAAYENYELPGLYKWKEVLKVPDLKGVNVTIPYKETIIPYLDELDAEARKIGAVNTITIKDGRIKGYNTDHIGFTESIRPLLKPHHTAALILGTGGSSAAVAYSLEQLGISCQFVSRHSRPGMLTYEQLNEALMAKHTILINTTPLGMYPNTEQAPAIPYQLLTPQHLLFDLVYNPEETLFLKKGKAADAVIKNGLEMLEIQAEAAWTIWNNH